MYKMAELRKKGVDVQPVEISGRKIALSFWGEGWCAHVESFGDFSNRLPRGRTYVRNGSVCHLEIRKGEVSAIVSGSDLYHVAVRIAPLSTKKWEGLTRRCTGRIGSLIDLLRGALSDDLMAVVTDRDDGLFPLPGEIKYECDCPDWAGMCKHIAAVIYGVGARLDSQPELLFTLRGVDHRELISAGAAVEAISEKGSGGSRSRRRSLAGQNLEGVFGVELDTAAEPAGRAKKKAAKRLEVRGGAGLRAAKNSAKKAAKKKFAKVAKDEPMRKTTKKKVAGKTAKKGTRKIAAGKSAKKSATKAARRQPAPFKPSARAVIALRERIGLKVPEFARAVGTSSATVARWESSKGGLTLQAKSLAALTRIHDMIG
jgi:uncharacterized Zn finger protein